MRNAKSEAGVCSRKKMIVSVLILFMVCSLFCFLAKGAYIPASNAAKCVVRLHIPANSNAPSDQLIKLKVRDAILEKYSSELRKTSDKDEAVSYLNDNLQSIARLADDVLEKNGFDYKAKAEMVECEFPQKAYGLFSFGQGEYRALRVSLGSGKGQNWWCVMYPPLCFINIREDASEEEHSEGSIRLKSVLEEWIIKRNDKAE